MCSRQTRGLVSFPLPRPGHVSHATASNDSERDLPPRPAPKKCRSQP